MTATTSPYPYAPAPDVIRAHQKDAYYTSHLANLLSTLARQILGARRAHALLSSTHLAPAPGDAPALLPARALYLGLTTLAGSRTLGEEYTDVVAVHAAGQTYAPATLARRSVYVLSAVVLPHLLGRGVPRLRTRLRTALQARAARLAAQGRGTSREARAWRYLAGRLDAGASLGASVRALWLAVFYFSGTYYEFAKRVLGLRYVFTRRVPETPDRSDAGYEVLGVLLALQMAVQSYLHVRAALRADAVPGVEEARRERTGATAVGAGTDISLSDNAYGTTTDLLLPDASVPGGGLIDMAVATHAPARTGPRYDLEDETAMGFIKGEQQRKCTLCLEPMREPAATPCGHVFCWQCIGDWVREKPECPLCRRESTGQHVLPLRTAV